MKCRAYEDAYTKTIQHIVDIVERYTWLFEDTKQNIAVETLQMDLNEVTESAASNGIADALADLEAMSRIENVTSVRI